MTDTRHDSRQKRLGAALRENLKRRKQQLRGRAAGEGGQDVAASPARDPARDEGEAAGCDNRAGGSPAHSG